MADVETPREEGEQVAEKTLLNGEAAEKDEADPSEETAKKRRKKKKKSKSAAPGKLERPRSASGAMRVCTVATVAKASASGGAREAVKLHAVFIS